MVGDAPAASPAPRSGKRGRNARASHPTAQTPFKFQNPAILIPLALWSSGRAEQMQLVVALRTGRSGRRWPESGHQRRRRTDGVAQARPGGGGSEMRGWRRWALHGETW
ncbi:hypothetical protein D1007_31866 [Hordeum vulgare]|uniref:Predicted protein n=2 Tax=Hordeum vulgare subsp. vulgare TaxID=112509 RepID=F2EBM1_HORVV|nr:hypothetical protein D1007_31866 [Hordeum vulgare]KAI4968271.1 hypothetical protein ZWY2020_060008 [Hordeum vulgare]BAK04743.1 predicted protein [Hordeum vulgare subsp. vulgare]